MNNLSRKIEIKFEKGGIFTANLLENEAPNTCETIWNKLPLTLEFYNSIVSGQAIVTLPKDLTVEPENQMTLGLPPGTLAFLVRDVPKLVPDEIYIVYGLFVSRGLTVNNYQPVNIFAQITENIEELKLIGKRILMKGAEKVTISQLN